MADKPLNVARWIDAQLIAGVVSALGRSMRTGRVQRRFISITSLEPGSPAERFGLRVGDVIVGMDEQSIASIDDLHKLLTRTAVGQEYKLTVIRDFEKITVSIVPQVGQ